MTEIYDVGASITLTIGESLRTFTIVDSVNSKGNLWYKQGGSAICYDAFYQESGIRHYGKLKKFYLSDESLDFAKMASEYEEPYLALQRLISDTSALNKLYTFIPAYDILHDSAGCPFIWTNSLPMLTFEELLGRILIDDHLNVYDALYQIIQPLKTLTDCIRILHIEDLIHGDINPANFGFYYRDGKILADGLSLFDLNTLHRTGTKQQWYNPPYYEKVQENAFLFARPNCADVRAIGVTLCKALFCSNEQVKAISEVHTFSAARSLKTVASILQMGGLYARKGIPDDIRVSDLLASIIIESVTKKASKRIDTCSALLHQFDTLEMLLLPHLTRKELSRGQSFELVNVEERRKNTIKRLQQLLLYEYPLYNYQSTAEIYKIYVFGFGSDAQRFTDSVLEFAQFMTVPVEIHIWGANTLRSEKDVYLKERPALCQFFLINNEHQHLTGDSYGSIFFHQMPGQSHQERVKNVLSGFDAAQYVYIAAGNDSDNELISRLCHEHMPDAFVVCQCNQSHIKENGIHFFCVERGSVMSDTAKELERFAFNAHLIRSGSLNTDIARKKVLFHTPYYHHSCVSTVLAIKYRLHLLGIDISVGTAAEEVSSRLMNNEAVKQEMIAYEHRRWVTEKLCDGWKPLPVESAPLFFGTKDFDGKRHTCIVQIHANSSLVGKWSDHALWDSASNEALSELDELDRMSVLLHRVYKKAAENIRSNDSLGPKMLADIMAVSDGCPELQSLILEWYETLTQLFNEYVSPFSKSKSLEPTLHMFDSLHARLIAYVHSTSFPNAYLKDVLLAKIKFARESIHPIIESLRYHDYKKNDLELIEGIPFIILYREDISVFCPCDDSMLIHPWRTGNAQDGFDAVNPTQLFHTVAASIVINPKTLYLVCDSIPDPSSEYFQEKKTSITNFLRRKGLQTELRFIERNALNATVAEVQNDDHFALVSKALEASLESSGIATFDFDTITQAFTLSPEAQALSYIQSSAYITSRDVATLLGRPYIVTKQPFYRKSEWQVLFGMYHTNVISRKAWKTICGLLKDDASRSEELAFLKTDEEYTSSCRHLLPFECYQSVDQIVTLLKDCKLISPQSTVERYSLDECIVEISTSAANRQSIDSVFLNWHMLMASNDYTIVKTRDGHSLRFDTLSVRGIRFDTEGLKHEIVQEVYHILSELQRHGFLQFCVHTNGLTTSLDVTYGSRQVKSMFMNEDVFLKMYTYYQLCESNTFDDINTGIRLMRTDTDREEHEIDIFMTKGFRTFFVECKAGRLLKNEESKALLIEWKRKLSEILSWYGINGKAFLVVDSEDEFDDIPDPEGIVTISKGAEITNIGNTIISHIQNGR